ncbi:MAG TPA: WD40 repeat domain-containing protein [Acidocella sp.]|jgi:DNA-binding beta-propeller fold protein YncE|uniref:WD40 repeat domain-containing protein n=1 Tax=Acidocella sp. TaxID=50710 RepID=UPI002C1643E2|nr:WD40 repeat domain-containing protein [Acidocella sp.]HVE20907.1 WD40 repeat domain-containing protein [Acidocella sp.]
MVNPMANRSSRNERVLGRDAAFLFVVVMGLTATPTYAAKADAPLVLERTIPLPNVAGRIDHMAVDVSTQRLFVAEVGDGSVDVVDLKSGKIEGRISGLKEPQGIAYVPDHDLIVVADGGDGSVRFFRGSDLLPLSRIDLGNDADNIRMEPGTNYLFVGYGDGGLAIIDAVRQAKLDDIKLPGHPESFQIDPSSRHAFVNVPEAHQIALVDLNSLAQISTWHFYWPEANFPMALAGPTGPLAVVFRFPATILFLDPATGTVIQKLGTCGDADDLFFDNKRHRVYVSCGDGSIDVFAKGAQGFRSIGRVQTSDGARTSLFVPALGRFFVAARAGWFRPQAAILVFRPSP